MTKLQLFLMLGYPGSGKTTASRILHQLTGAVHLWADYERKQRFAHPTYDHAENLKLYEQLNKEVEALLAAGQSVIFDTNFNFYKDRQRLSTIAERYNGTTIVVWVKTPKNIARNRATRDAHTQATRILGDMPVAHFERIARNLQPPRANETVIALEGTGITTKAVRDALRQI